ncbi:MAG: hypothetical protein JSU57_01795 [Candidatus Heimdallarchaeota archaeon]|nr:MAG: hypothetical protein JSU57_01795 [Candidatus Heimdallarchaeota archaeon]
MQQSQSRNVLCETTCKFLKCSERFLSITRKRGEKKILCRMVEGDECIGYKCKYAVCFFRPSALDISTGVCSQKTKKNKHQRKQKPDRKYIDDDPLKYRGMLDKKMRKNLKLKDFY